MDLETAINEFLDDLKSSGRSVWTVRNYRTGLKKLVQWCGETSVDWRELTPRHVRQFRKWLASKYDGPATPNLSLSAASSFYAFAVDEGWVTYNPFVCRHLLLPQPETLPRFLQDDEVKRVLNYVRENLPSVYLPYRTMLYTGARAGEVARLKASDVIRRGDRVILRLFGKGGRERYVPVTDAETAAVLLELAETVRREQGRDVRLFKVSYHTIVNYATKVEQATGVDFTSHMLRHTFATRLRASGEQLDVIQKVLGHKNIATTVRYAATPASWERLAARGV